MWPETRRTLVCLTTITVGYWKATQEVLRTTASFFWVDPVSKNHGYLLSTTVHADFGIVYSECIS